jgi:amino acid transporter
VFVTAAFSFSGTELVGLAAAESENPGKSLPSAIKQVFWRVTLFYVLSLTFVGLLIDHDDPRLLGNGSYIDVTASPFVIVAERAGVIGFAHFTNVVIMLSVVSIGLSGVYGGSRTLCALAEQGYAPRFFSYIDRAGRPLFATLFIIAWSPLAFMTLSTGGTVAFDWLQSLSGLAALFTWGSICFSHIRFRNAWKYHGHTVDEIPFTAIFGVTGSWIGLGLVIIVLIAQVSFEHHNSMSSAPSLTFLSSSTPPSTPSTPRASSSRTSPSSSSSSSTSSAGSGSARPGRLLRRSTSTLAAARLTGRSSTPSAPLTPSGPSGGGLPASSSDSLIFLILIGWSSRAGLPFGLTGWLAGGCVAVACHGLCVVCCFYRYHTLS